MRAVDRDGDVISYVIIQKPTHGSIVKIADDNNYENIEEFTGESDMQLSLAVSPYLLSLLMTAFFPLKFSHFLTRKTLEKKNGRRRKYTSECVMMARIKRT